MSLEVITNDKTLFKIGVQVVLHHLCLAELVPRRLLGIVFVINKAYGIGVALADAVYVFQFPALDEKLDFKAHRVREAVRLALSRIVMHLYKIIIF